MKILVIFTGGTIGSSVSEGYISTDNSKSCTILKEYDKAHKTDITWDTISPYTILSENISPKTYEILAKAVKDGLKKDYDGIIITHGSDTIQYTAAFLDCILGTECIPVMIVCSNYVLEDSRANGMANFEAAVDFIINKRGRGVFVPYQNTGEDCTIHRGTMLLPHMPFSDSLYSADDKWIGKYHSGEYRINTENNEFEKRVAQSEPNEYNDKTGVLIVYQYPGMVYPKLEEDIKSVMLLSYHSGTIRTDSELLNNFIEDANRKNVKLFLVGAGDGMEYDSCKEYNRMGIRVIKKTSPIAAYIKIWLGVYN